ncbi:MAG: hypothetical protein OXI02_07720 [Candidatus Dadabacteria bacterium]|nr:hypothetical protein [Candidatus Dadabacteria bacterium]MDE0477929.1 hypothetical protein [Candidatus Dadabacteria bacterium]
MKSLEDFAMPLEIQKLVEGEFKPCKFPTKAYGVDKSLPEDGKDLKGQYGMDSTHSCDYMLINDSNVLLLEDSNIRKKKEDLEEEYSEELSIRIIGKEQLLKAYASLLLLCRISSSDRTTRRLIKGKTVSFCVVCSDVERKDFRVLWRIEGYLKEPLRNLVSEVHVLPLSGVKGLTADYPGI